MLRHCLKGLTWQKCAFAQHVTETGAIEDQWKTVHPNCMLQDVKTGRSGIGEHMVDEKEGLGLVNTWWMR